MSMFYMRFVPVDIIPCEEIHTRDVRESCSYTVEEYLKFANACESLGYEYQYRGNLRQSTNYAHTRLLMLLKALLTLDGHVVTIDQDDIHSLLRLLEMTHPDIIHCMNRLKVNIIEAYGNNWKMPCRGTVAWDNYQNASKILWDYICSVIGEAMYELPTLEGSTVFASDLNKAYEDALIEKGYQKVINVSNMFGVKSIIEVIHNLPGNISDIDNRIDYLINMFR